MVKQFLFFLIMFFSLGACTNTNTTPANLPLANNKPTFLFFYTDNWAPWMQMQPIVNGLQDEYNSRVEFIIYNALDNAEGEAFFQQLNLPGHPSIVIYSAEGQQIYLGFGIVEESQLQEELTQAISE